jgi:hypothetical protein
MRGTPSETLPDGAFRESDHRRNIGDILRAEPFMRAGHANTRIDVRTCEDVATTIKDLPAPGLHDLDLGRGDPGAFLPDLGPHDLNPAKTEKYAHEPNGKYRGERAPA